MAPCGVWPKSASVRSALSAYKKAASLGYFEQGHDIICAVAVNLTRLEASPRLLAPVSTAPKRRSDRAHVASMSSSPADCQCGRSWFARAAARTMMLASANLAIVRPSFRTVGLANLRDQDIGCSQAAKFGVHCPSKSTSIRARILANIGQDRAN